MPCTITKGRSLPCKSAFGGIKNVYFLDFGNIDQVTFDAATGISTLSYTVGGSSDWFKYEVKGNSSLETAVTSSRENGTTFYTQTLNLTLTYLDALTQIQLEQMAISRPNVIVEDYYGNFFGCGIENGMEVTGGTVVTGAAAGDLSGFTLVLEGMEETAPLFLNAAPSVSIEVIVPN